MGEAPTAPVDETLQADSEADARQPADRHGRGHARPVVRVAPIASGDWTWRLRLSWRRDPDRGRRGIRRFIPSWRNRLLRNLDPIIIRRCLFGFRGRGLQLVAGRRQEIGRASWRERMCQYG